MSATLQAPLLLVEYVKALRTPLHLTCSRRYSESTIMPKRATSTDESFEGRISTYAVSDSAQSEHVDCARPR